MSDFAIQAEGLGKRYRVGVHPRYRAMRDTLTELIYAPVRIPRLLRHGRRTAARADTTLWALRDVSFEIRHGDVVGLIGRNGAGKSTLLKVLSRITEPTEGTARLEGRLGSMLEIGTGFHPELTGRENVYLNGAILGMRKAEISRRFDEIVEFAGVERFIDTPVKRYSSGMQVRLAFGVAAHLETEILLVDEVLAVGDAAFQKKCLGRMSEVGSEGRTVLLVSHNLASIRGLCPTSIWIDGGRLMEFGPSHEVIDAYLELSREHDSVETVFPDDPELDFQVKRVRFVGPTGDLQRVFACDEPPIIEVQCDVRRPVPGLYGILRISTLEGLNVIEAFSHDISPNPLAGLSVGTHLLRIGIPPRSLGHGTYAANLKFGTPFDPKATRVHEPREIGTFHLDDFDTPRGNDRTGFFSMGLNWSVSSPHSRSNDVTRSQTEIAG